MAKAKASTATKKNTKAATEQAPSAEQTSSSEQASDSASTDQTVKPDDSTSAVAGDKPEETPPKPANVTKVDPKVAAAKFVGIPVDQVFHYVKHGERFVVITTSGRKLKETPAEREAAAIKARKEAEARAAKKAAAKARK
ncbi:MAG: hypothetical protein R3332_08345 [Pseudohongiellaceae bacterium]|nr:hypothetical protein [Pseudohongiellaceae bacterium]